MALPAIPIRATHASPLIQMLVLTKIPQDYSRSDYTRIHMYDRKMMSNSDPRPSVCAVNRPRRLNLYPFICTSFVPSMRRGAIYRRNTTNTPRSFVIQTRTSVRHK
jgi:hypothetical protein